MSLRNYKKEVIENENAIDPSERKSFPNRMDDDSRKMNLECKTILIESSNYYFNG